LLVAATPDPAVSTEDPVVTARSGEGTGPEIDPVPPRGEPGLSPGASDEGSVGVSPSGLAGKRAGDGPPPRQQRQV